MGTSGHHCLLGGEALSEGPRTTRKAQGGPLPGHLPACAPLFVLAASPEPWASRASSWVLVKTMFPSPYGQELPTQRAQRAWPSMAKAGQVLHVA